MRPQPAVQASLVPVRTAGESSLPCFKIAHFTTKIATDLFCAANLQAPCQPQLRGSARARPLIALALQQAMRPRPRHPHQAAATSARPPRCAPACWEPAALLPPGQRRRRRAALRAGRRGRRWRCRWWTLPGALCAARLAARLPALVIALGVCVSVVYGCLCCTSHFMHALPSHSDELLWTQRARCAKKCALHSPALETMLGWLLHMHDVSGVYIQNRCCV